MSSKRSIVSSQVAILDAIERIGREDMRDAPILTSWAEEAEKKIGGFYSFKREIEVLDVCGCKVKLPCGVFDVEGLLIGDHGKSCGLVFDQLCNIPTSNIDFKSSDLSANIVVIYPGSGKSLTPVQYSIQDGHIVLDRDLDGQKITVKLLKWHTDIDGFIMVEEDHIEAIGYFIMLRLAERSRFGKNKMTFSDIQWFQKKWDFHCLQARSASGEESKTEKDILTSLYNNPLSGVGFVFNEK